MGGVRARAPHSLYGCSAHPSCSLRASSWAALRWPGCSCVCWLVVGGAVGACLAALTAPFVCSAHVGSIDRGGSLDSLPRIRPGTDMSHASESTGKEHAHARLAVPDDVQPVDAESGMTRRMSTDVDSDSGSDSAGPRSRARSRSRSRSSVGNGSDAHAHGEHDDEHDHDGEHDGHDHDHDHAVHKKKKRRRLVLPGDVVPLSPDMEVRPYVNGLSCARRLRSRRLTGPCGSRPSVQELEVVGTRGVKVTKVAGLEGLTQLKVCKRRNVCPAWGHSRLICVAAACLRSRCACAQTCWPTWRALPTSPL